MKSFHNALLLIVMLLSGTLRLAAQDSGYMMIKSNINGNLGADVGISLTGHIGVKAGMMVDLYRPDTDDGSYKDSLGHKYRLSYTAGPYFKLSEYFAISVSAGYGEIGTYGYNSLTDQYGISGKINGLELGLQLQINLNDVMFEVGYGTLPKSFGLERAFTDISFGIGMLF